VFWDDRAQAERLIDGALAQLPREPQFNGIAANCLVTRAQIAELKLEGEATVDAARKALDRLAAGALASSFLKVDAEHMVAMGYRLLGKTGRAERAFAAASEELERIGGADTNSGLTLVHNWALTRALYDPLGALELQARVLARQGSEQAGDAGAATHVMSYGYCLLRLARYAEARAALEKAVRFASAPDAVSTRGLAALGVSCACRHLGDLACADAAVRNGRAWMSQAADEDSFSGETLQEPALLAAAHGDVEGARRGLSQALAIYEKRNEKTVSHLEALTELARLELRAGRVPDAERRARQALALALEMRDDLPRSAWVGTSQVLLAEALEARGDVAAARDLFRESIDQMASTLGENHPLVKEARARLAR
jgi:tetratricopeptide (TPR) repeat protein